MKGRIKNIVIVWLCLMFVLASCTDNIVPNSVRPDNEEKIPIALDLQGLIDAGAQTRALVYPGDSVQGFGKENEVVDVTAYIFDQYYQCEEIIQENVPPISDRVGPVMVTVGTKHIVVVLNGIGKMPLETNTTGAPYPPGVSYNALLERLTNDSGATPPPDPFLMTGLKNNVPLPTQVPITSPHIIPVEVKRAIAKVKFSIGKSAKAAGPGRAITLTDITMYQGARRVGLVRAPSPNPTIYDVTQSAYVPLGGITVPDLTGSPGSYSGYAAVDDSIYTYESLCGKDTTKAVRVEVKWDVNGTARTSKFFLALDNSSGDTVYNVKRNTWYDVKMNIVDPGSDSVVITVIACPWNVADTITPPPVGAGAAFNTALPFKLVKNLTTAEMSLTNSSGRSYAAIESHTKGASWIDLKVTSGTQWKLDVKDTQPWNDSVYYSTDSATWIMFPDSSLTDWGDDEWHRIYIYRPYRENNEPKRGPSLHVSLYNDDLSDFVHKQDFIIEPRDTLPIPINSYILRPQLTGAPLNETRAYIPLAGVFSHWEDYILDGGPLPNLTLNAVVLWQDRPLGEAVVRNVEVRNAGNRDAAYIYAEAGYPGNAIIAMRLNSTDIYWTFHVWVTEYNPYEAAGQKFYETKESDPPNSIRNVFMDRNLGAMSNVNDAEGNARGLFYQYGRKDPFPRGENWGNSTLKWYNILTNSWGALLFTNTTTATPDFRPKVAIPYTLSHPYEFITTSGGWPLHEENPNLWISPGGNKTAYDPCPEGWRVPEMSYFSPDAFPWEGELLGNSANGFNSTTNGWYSPLVGFYPYSGFIDESGALVINSGARFWTSYSLSPNTAVGLFFDNSNPPEMNTSLNKAWGVSVRCVVDKNYILNVENGGLFGTGINNLKNVLFLP